MLSLPNRSFSAVARLGSSQSRAQWRLRQRIWLWRQGITDRAISIEEESADSPHRDPLMTHPAASHPRTHPTFPTPSSALRHDRNASPPPPFPNWLSAAETPSSSLLLPPMQESPAGTSSPVSCNAVSSVPALTMGWCVSAPIPLPFPISRDRVLSDVVKFSSGLCTRFRLQGDIQSSQFCHLHVHVMVFTYPVVVYLERFTFGSWTLLSVWSAHHKGVRCLIFSEDDSLLISGADDGTVFVWSLVRVLDRTEERQATSSATPKLHLYRWSGHKAPVTAVSVSTGASDAIVVSASLDHTCKVWSIGAGKLLQSIQLQSAVTSSLLHLSANAMYLGTTAGRISICTLYPLSSDVNGEVLRAEFIAHSSSVTALSISTDGRFLISGSEDKIVRVWGVPSGDLIKELHLNGPVTNLCMIPGCYLSSDNDCKCRKLNRASPSLMKGPQTELCENDDPTMFVGASAVDEQDVAFSVRELDKQQAELKLESTPAALAMKIAILKEKHARACKTNKEYLQQTELLKALSTEVHPALAEKKK